MEKRRYALRIAYDGGDFRGFQRQPGLPSVEQALLDALAILGIAPRLEVAARTDAGVHALSQFVSFWARADLEPAALREAVNRGSPPALTCLEAWRAQLYAPEHLIVSAAGAVDEDELLSLAERYFGAGTAAFLRHGRIRLSHGLEGWTPASQ